MVVVGKAILYLTWMGYYNNMEAVTHLESMLQKKKRLWPWPIWDPHHCRRSVALVSGASSDNSAPLLRVHTCSTGISIEICCFAVFRMALFPDRWQPSTLILLSSLKRFTANWKFAYLAVRYDLLLVPHKVPASVRPASRMIQPQKVYAPWHQTSLKFIVPRKEEVFPPLCTSVFIRTWQCPRATSQKQST